MTTPTVPLPSAPPPPPPRGSNRVLVWLIALAIVVVVAAAAVMIVWLTRGDDPVAIGASTTTIAAASSTEPTTAASSPATSSSSTAAPATSTSTSTTTSTPTTTSTTTSTTTTLPPGACSPLAETPIPEEATVLTEVMGDFDGDGTADDRFSLYSFVGVVYTGTHPHLRLSYGHSVSQPTFTPSAVAAEARAVNLGGPADVAVVQIAFEFGRGAYLWAFHDCELHLVMESDTHDMGFALVDGPLEKRGLRCLEDRISVVQAHSEDGITWWAGGYTLLWDPATATLHKPPWFGPGDGPITALVPLHRPEDDALIQSYADFDC